MAHLLIWLQFLLMLIVFKDTQALPIRELSSEEWESLLELIGKSKNPTLNNKEFYESFTLKPIIFTMDYDNNFIKKDSIEIKSPKFNKKMTTVSLEKKPEETNLWTSVKSFFTNDLNAIAKDVAENYNPIPPIVSVIDDVKRSDTWVDINSFFTKSYNRLANFSESVVDDIKMALKEEPKN